MEDQKRKALISALERTDDLMDFYMDILRQDFGPKTRERKDFSKAVDAILPTGSGTELEKVSASSTLSEKADERLTMSFKELQLDSLACTRCDLCRARNNVVFGTGCTDRPVVMVIGEGPGENEDLQGLPFVGKAGKYLDAWLAAISLSRESNVYITNTVKCRPPGNRDPYPEEKAACFAFLKQQIEIIHPQAILCLGRPASTMMTGQIDAPMGALRGHFHFYDGIPMMCTYHPAAVLRNLEYKRPVWEDLKKLAKYLGLETGGRR